MAQTRSRQPVRSRNAPVVTQRRQPLGGARARDPVRDSSESGGYERPSPRGGQRNASPTESEDEAYGGSPASEDEEIRQITEDSEPLAGDSEDNRADDSEDQETPRRIPPKTNNRAAVGGPRARVNRTVNDTPRSTDSKPPAGARRVIKGKAAVGRGKGRAGQNGDGSRADETFGDDERKCVKEFKEAYAQFTKNVEMNEMPLEQQIQHLSALADVYKRSSSETLNIYNLLRASGLYNYCLKKAEEHRPDLVTEIHENLIAFEDAAMRRVLKLQSKQCHLFAHDKKRNLHLKDLKEIRDICTADFKTIKDSLRELPSANTLLKQKAPSHRAIKAEENVMATTSLMFGEVTERVKALLAGMIAECHEIQGPPPCNFVIAGNYRFGTRDLSPFDPISVFIVIEKEGAGIRNYFRNTLALLGMKILNLGETSLPSLNIRSLTWFSSQVQPSGFSLVNYIDENEKKDFSTIPLDCLRTTKELLKLAVSDRQSTRLSLVSMLHGATFITGDLKMYKELSQVRSTALQREQTEKFYKRELFTSYQALVTGGDPFSSFALQQGNEDEIQANVLNLVTDFLTLFCEMEKSFTAEGTINKIEEMMQVGANITYSNTTISTDIRQKQGVVSTISTRLETPPTRSPSPEPVRLPDIPVVFKPKNTTWTIQEVDERSRRSPIPNQDDALKVLKEKKKAHRTEFTRASYHHVVRGPSNHRGSRGSTQGGGSVSDVSTSTASSGSTWKKQQRRKKKPQKIPDNQPTPEPIERFVYIVPTFDGKQKNLLSSESARCLVLLHSLSSAINLSNNSATAQISTKHQKAFTISSKEYEAAYIRILQVVVPFVSTLSQLVFTTDYATGNLKKGLQRMELNVDDDEFVVALTHFQNRKYPACCKAIYKYLENRSDITFIGEPFPSDFTEVCQELLEDNALTAEKYHAVQLLMAHSQMRRGAHDEALSHWSELLSKAETPKEKAYIYHNMAECCIKIGRKEDAGKAINRSMSLYREAVTADKLSYDGELNKLQEMKSSLK